MDLRSPETQYGILIVGLFIVARVLQRLRLPAAITSVAIGALLGIGFGMFREDATLPLLATLGIVTLFLHAGLDVDIGELRSNARVLASHLVLQIALLSIGTIAASLVFGLDTRPALLVALAVLTPSTGFILDALPSLALDADAQRWVKTKAIASEIFALLALFVAVHSTSVVGLASASLALVLMVVLLPAVFTGFVRFVLPYAPKSEFTFLVVVAFVCAFLTLRLGVYYLVGAFVVGVTAVRMRGSLPVLVSPHVLGAIELFASFFVPFYFFKAGTHLTTADFTFASLGVGFFLLLFVLPVRVVAIALHRKAALGEPVRAGTRVGLALLPTLVFTIVIANILRERFAIPAHLYGGLIVYTLTNTMLPGLFMAAGRTPEAELAPRAELHPDRGTDEPREPLVVAVPGVEEGGELEPDELGDRKGDVAVDERT